MKKIILTLQLLFIVFSVSVGQRTLQIVSDTMTTHFDEAVLANEVYIAENLGFHLGKYDGDTFTTFPYPVVGGVQLRYILFGPGASRMHSYRGQLLFLLNNEFGSYLYAFQDPDFQQVVPYKAVSNLVMYQDRIYLLMDSGGIVKLYSYDGREMREASPFTFSEGVFYSLVADNPGFSFYIYHRNSMTGSPDVFRYTNGILQNLSSLEFSNFGFDEVVSITGPENTYFQQGNNIYYYNGSSISDINPPSIFRAEIMQAWEGRLYFLGTTGLEPHLWLLYSCISGECNEILMPEGTLIQQQTVIYRDKLHFVLRISGIDYIYSYDGTTFTRIFEFPQPTISPRLRIREGNLVVLSNYTNPGFAYEYDGDTFTVIRTPNEEYFISSLESTVCYHTWLIAPHDDFGDIKYALAIEVPDSTCTPPVAPVPVAIIPERLRDYDRFITIPHVRLEPPWCWTGVDLDWEIIPVCDDPPCPIPQIEAKLTDNKGEIVSSLKDNKAPFSMEFNVTKSYTLSLAAENSNGKFDQVLTFDKDLAKNGIDDIKLDIHPKDDYFYMTVVTRKTKQVPFTMTLRSSNSDILWQQNFVAPMDKLVRAFVSKAGAYLQFSIPKNNAAINFYPNPFTGTLNVDVSEETIPLVITLTDMNGKVVAEKEVSTSEVHSISAGNQLPGLYIISISDGKHVRRELVMLE